MPNQLKPKTRLLKILKKFVIFVGWIMENMTKNDSTLLLAYILNISIIITHEASA